MNLASGIVSLVIGGIQYAKPIKLILTNITKKATIRVGTALGLIEAKGGEILQYIPSSGVKLITTSGKTTTVLGTYDKDLKYVINELGVPKSIDLDGNVGGFNLLNVPDELYKNPQQFWLEYNKPWLDAAINRGDDIILATKPSELNLYTKNHTLTGFGREFEYLQSCGYRYCPTLQKMIKTGG